MRSLACLFACVAMFSSMEGQIVETAHFSELLNYIDDETLVLLDIDDTLLIPAQMLGCDEWFLHRLKIHAEKGVSKKEALEKSLAEWEAIRHLTKMNIVEPGSESIVRKLQEEGYNVMGLTTQGLALATRTTIQLKENGIDLSLAAPDKHDQYLLVRGHGVLYRNGVLFTSGTQKGEALFALCQAIGYTPKRIVFLNDKSTHIQEIEIEAEKRGIDFLGLRYSFSDARKAEFSPELAHVQFTHSTIDHLLSDEEAKKLVSTN